VRHLARRPHRYFSSTAETIRAAFSLEHWVTRRRPDLGGGKPIWHVLKRNG